MIVEFINTDYAAIWVKLLIVSAAWGGVFVAVIIDLVSGIMKARSLGECRTSEGYRRSIKKFNYYYSMMAYALLFDALCPFFYYLPFPLSVTPVITLICAMGLVFTEAKSVREKADEKLRRKTDSSFQEIAAALAKNKDAAEKMLDFLQNEKNKQDEKATTD